MFSVAVLACVAAWQAGGSPRSVAAAKLARAEEARAAKEREAAQAAQAVRADQAAAADLGARRVREAAALRETEENVVAAATRLAQAQAAQAAAEAELWQLRAAFATMVPLIVRLARDPEATVLAVPQPPEQALEGLLLARGVAASLNREAQAMRAAADKAAQLRAATARQQAALARERAHQIQAAAALDKEITATQAALYGAAAVAENAAADVAALGAQAQTLKDAIAAMDAAEAQAREAAAREAALARRQRKPGAAQAALARQAALSRPGGGAGRLVAPVAGPVVRVFGAPEADGTATGITFSAAPEAFVVSPCAGRVAFAAPFRSYGKLVIQEGAGSQDVVLAGLGRIDAAPGRSLRAGEPLGRMPGGSGPALYVELRAHGVPVDPLPFLSAKG